MVFNHGHVRSGQGYETAFRILVVLCLLAIASLLVPAMNATTKNDSLPVSVYPDGQDYALLAFAFTRGDSLYKANAPGTFRKIISRGTNAVPATVRRFQPGVVLVRNIGFDTVLPRDFQQACQLLDTPPPAVPTL